MHVHVTLRKGINVPFLWNASSRGFSYLREKIDVTYLANPSNLLEKVLPKRSNPAGPDLWTPLSVSDLSVFSFSHGLSLLFVSISIITTHGIEKIHRCKTESGEKLARRQRVRVEGRQKSE